MSASQLSIALPTIPMAGHPQCQRRQPTMTIAQQKVFWPEINYTSGKKAAFSGSQNFICANCGRNDHGLSDCVGPVDHTFCLYGCPIHGTWQHSYDDCWHPTAFTDKTINIFLVLRRTGKAPIFTRNTRAHQLIAQNDRGPLSLQQVRASPPLNWLHHNYLAARLQTVSRQRALPALPATLGTHAVVSLPAATATPGTATQSFAQSAIPTRPAIPRHSAVAGVSMMGSHPNKARHDTLPLAPFQSGPLVRQLTTPQPSFSTAIQHEDSPHLSSNGFRTTKRSRAENDRDTDLAALPSQKERLTVPQSEGSNKKQLHTSNFHTIADDYDFSGQQAKRMKPDSDSFFSPSHGRDSSIQISPPHFAHPGAFVFTHTIYPENLNSFVNPSFAVTANAVAEHTATGAQSSEALMNMEEKLESENAQLKVKQKELGDALAAASLLDEMRIQLASAKQENHKVTSSLNKVTEDLNSVSEELVTAKTELESAKQSNSVVITLLTGDNTTKQRRLETLEKEHKDARKQMHTHQSSLERTKMSETKLIGQVSELTAAKDRLEKQLQEALLPSAKTTNDVLTNTTSRERPRTSEGSMRHPCDDELKSFSEFISTFHPSRDNQVNFTESLLRISTELSGRHGSLNGQQVFENFRRQRSAEVFEHFPRHHPSDWYCLTGLMRGPTRCLSTTSACPGCRPKEIQCLRVRFIEIDNNQINEFRFV